VEDLAGDGGKDDHTPDNAGGLQFTRCPGVCRRVGGCADAGPGAVAWAVTTMNVGNAWKNRIAGDRRANIDKAIACYQDALAVRTHDANAVAWATTAMNLGNAIVDRIGGGHEEVIDRAIACEEAASTVRDVLPALPDDMTAVTDFRGRVALDPDPVDPVARVSASAVHAAVVQVQSARELRLDVLGTEGFDALLSGPPLSPGVLLSELPSTSDLAPPPPRSDVTSFHREPLEEGGCGGL
jgi:hypothetical protein